MKKLPLFLTGVLLLVIGQNVKATTTFNFDPTVTGTQAWTTGANWGVYAPSTQNDDAIINLTTSTGDVALTNTTGSTTVGQLDLTATSTSAITFVLSNNFTILNSSFGSTRSVWTNAGAASQLVFDLQGNTFNTIAGVNFPLILGPGFSNPSFTVKSTGDTGGTIIFTEFAGSGNVSLQNNATILAQGRTTATNPIDTTHTTFSATSTFIVTGGNGNDFHRSNFAITTTPTGNNAFGNLTIGDTTATHAATAVNFANASSGSALTVRGNMVVAQNADLYLAFPGSASTMKIAGNYSDAGSGMFTTYTNTATTNATLSMNGGIGSMKTLSINRTLNSSGGFSMSVQIGDGTNAGNVQLVNPSSTVGALYTSGGARVFANSRLDLGTSTTSGNIASLRAGSITIDGGATIADSFGLNSGYGVADTSLGGSGLLTLNTFNLELNYDGTGWTSGTNLVFFNYTSLTGTPTLGTVTFNTPGAWTAALVNTGSSIQINLTAVPEPSAALLIGAFGGLVVWTVRRKNRAAKV